MIEQFQNVLQSSRPSQEQILKSTQDLLLNTLEVMFPPDYDFSDLANIFDEKDLKENMPLLTYNLVKYFVDIVSQNFVSVHSYQSLEEQTQKIQSTIRSHIKLEQEVKMYLEHLEMKILKYQNYITYFLKKTQGHSRNNSSQEMPTTKETTLIKERLSLIRKNQALQRKLTEKQNQLKKLNLMSSEKIDIMENFKEKDKMILSKSQIQKEFQPEIPGVQLFKEKLSERNGHSQLLSEQKQKEDESSKHFQIKISGSNNQFNCYIGK